MTVVFGFLTAVLLVGATGMILSAFLRSSRKAWPVLTLLALFYLWIVGDTLLPQLVTTMQHEGGHWFMFGVVPGVFLTWFFIHRNWSYFIGTSTKTK